VIIKTLKEVFGSAERTNLGRLGNQFDRNVPLSPILQDGAKGHNLRGKTLPVSPRPLGRGASIQAKGGRRNEKNY